MQSSSIFARQLQLKPQTDFVTSTDNRLIYVSSLKCQNNLPEKTIDLQTNNFMIYNMTKWCTDYFAFHKKQIETMENREKLLVKFFRNGSM